MVELESIAGKALVAATTGTTAPSTEAARESAQLFLYDVTQTVRWHAAVAGVALAATPLVYQLSRIVAQRCRAELVSAAKDAVQREELFNGAEADGVLIDPADEGGITISYHTLSRSRQRHNKGDGVTSAAQSQHEIAHDTHHHHNNSSSNNHDSGNNSSVHYGGGSPAEYAEDGSEVSSARSATSTASATLAMRVGRRHSWAISSFAHQVLAAQRAPNVQFVRTCSRAAVCQYGVVVLRACVTSCVLSVAALSLTHGCCTVLDKCIPLTPSDTTYTSASNAVVGVGSLLRDFASAPLFDTAAGSGGAAAASHPQICSIYGLYSFSASAGGVWSRLVPPFGVLQTLDQRFLHYLQPVHWEWRRSLSGVRDAFSLTTSSPADARADAVWAALSPRGYFCATLLTRLPWRVLSGLRYGREKLANAVMRWWYDRAAAAASTAAAAAGAGAVSNNASGVSGHSSSSPTPPPQAPHKSPRHQQQQQQQRRGSESDSHNAAAKPKRHKKLIHSPLVVMATLFASDVAFAGLVFVATSLVSTGGGSGSGGLRPLVPNAAGARYNVYCWVEAASSVVSLVSW